MSVLVYVGHSRRTKIPKEPEYSHEVTAVIDICQSLRDRAEESVRTYAVLVSPQHAGRTGNLYADVVILTSLGLGILELKNYSEKIICKRYNEPWLIETPTQAKKRIKAGKYINPHQQVQAYGEQIWNKLTMSATGLPRVGIENKVVQFQTAVCFSNINANVDSCKDYVNKYYQSAKILKKWEKKFEVLTLRDVRDWAFQLRFDTETDPLVPIELTKEEIHNIATDFFGCKVWKEMDDRIQEPYGYLALTREDRSRQHRHIFRLTRKKEIIGRDAATCSLLLPERFEKVSRTHAAIQHKRNGIYLQDLGSRNGTLVNQHPLQPNKPFCLQEHQKIILGDEQCELIFSTKPFLNETGKPDVTKTVNYDPHQENEAEEEEYTAVAFTGEEKPKRRFWHRLFSSE